MQYYLGETLALTTALLWAFTSVFFTLAGRKVGSHVVNRTRLLLAVPFLSVAHLLTQGNLVPLEAEPRRWLWLGISAIVGLVVGDGLLFYAFTAIGARLSMLLMALNPIIGAIFAWLFLGETLQPMEIIAITLSISGVAWVVMERNRPQLDRTAAHPDSDDGRYLIGVLAGLGGATGQATGLVLSKQGMIGDFPALSASFMRVAVAAAVIWIAALIGREARVSLASLTKPQTGWLTLGGTLVGPVLGMTLSLASVQMAEVGIASTLMAMSPVLLLPLSHWIFHERITLRAVMGTIVAMAGVTLIFLS
ncbi:MAG: DMT family transporter [Anaerolineae bacterium]